MNKPRFGVIASIAQNGQLMKAIRATQQAQTCEFRLDLMPSIRKFDCTVEDIALCALTRKVILTFRAQDQGGQTHMSLDEQYDFWWDGLAPGLRDLVFQPRNNVYVDLSYDLIMHIRKNGKPPPFTWDKAGVSLHHMDNTPSFEEMRDELVAMVLTPAKVFIKFVTMLLEPEDVHRLEKLYEYPTGPRPRIFFGMGALGKDFRRDSMTKLGSDGMFVYPDGQKPTAPGQWSLSEAFDDIEIRKVLGLHTVS